MDKAAEKILFAGCYAIDPKQFFFERAEMEVDSIHSLNALAGYAGTVPVWERPQNPSSRNRSEERGLCDTRQGEDRAVPDDRFALLLGMTE